jgi:hypothetical protein
MVYNYYFCVHIKKAALELLIQDTMLYRETGSTVAHTLVLADTAVGRFFHTGKRHCQREFYSLAAGMLGERRVDE